MGYICHKFLLVILHIFQLGRHVVEGCGKISYLILRINRDDNIQIAGSILLCCIRNLDERAVDQKMYTQQNNVGAQ